MNDVSEEVAATPGQEARQWAMFVSFLLMLVVIGFFLLGLVCLAALVLTIIAGIKANEGKAYRYPFCLRLIK